MIRPIPDYTLGFDGNTKGSEYSVSISDSMLCHEWKCGSTREILMPGMFYRWPVYLKCAAAGTANVDVDISTNADLWRYALTT